MLSEKDENALADLCDSFINSGDSITLAHLLDFVAATIPDTGSQEWKSWTKHMEQLNEVWCQRNKEGENVPWPQPPIQKKAPEASAATDTSSNKSGSERAKLSVGHVRVKISEDEWKVIPISKLDKFLKSQSLERQIGGQGAGPIRHKRSINNVKRAGKPRDQLVDQLIIETEEIYEQAKSGMRDVVYCVACLEKAVGRSPQRVKGHAKDCGVCQFIIFMLLSDWSIESFLAGDDA